MLQSETFGPYEYGHEVKEKAGGGDRGEPDINVHGFRSSRIVAETDISERDRRQPDDDAYPQQVVHLAPPLESGGKREDSGAIGDGAYAVLAFAEIRLKIGRL